ncbi:MAG: SMI1/KNR4 family protein [Candidatus Hermodarchaeota archaeon]
MLNQSQIDDINRKIDILQYERHPCIKKEELISFETTAGIILPRDYRDFLLHIGNGVGWVDLNSLQESLRVLEYRGGKITDLGKSFPLKRSGDYKVVAQHASKFLQPRQNLNDFYNSITSGYLEIVTGVDLSVLLIISGEERGNIWHVKRFNEYEDKYPIKYPHIWALLDEERRNKPVSFYRWYITNLDEKLARWKKNI